MGRMPCAVIANTLEEAVLDSHYNVRGVFDRQILTEAGREINALPLPIVPNLQSKSEQPKQVPVLGEYDNIQGRE